MRYEIFSSTNIPLLKINSIGFSADTSTTKFGPGVRKFYIIHYVTKGKGYYNGNLITAGQGFLIMPGQFEHYYPDNNDPWEFLWIISSDPLMKQFFEKYNANVNTMIFEYNSIPVVKKISNEIITKNKSMLDSLILLEMFLHIFNSHTHNENISKPQNNSDIYLDFCIKYIETNIHNKITVNELTNLLGISAPYLYKIFSKRFNMSLKQYIIWQKINHAKKMLLETNMSITQIANSAGYNDVLSFSKAFSRNEKMSPKKYRTHKKVET